MPSLITSDNGVSSGSAGLKTTAASDGSLALQTTTAGGTATTAVTIDTSQNVGVGVTPSGNYQLQAGSGSGAAGRGFNLMTLAGGYSGGDYPIFGYNFRTTTTGGSYLYNGSDVASAIGFSSVITFNTASSGTAGNSISFSERARIDSSGNLLVGKTSIANAVGPELNANGQIRSIMAGSTNSTSTNEVFSTGAGAYRFFVGLGGTVYATSTTISSLSDQRHKENIRDLNVGLSEIMALKPRLFDWKEGKGADIKDARGFIAQEFEQVFPDLIDEWRDPAPEGEEPYKSVRADLIPVLVKAIQEQQALIAQLQADVAALKGNA